MKQIIPTVSDDANKLMQYLFGMWSYGWLTSGTIDLCSDKVHALPVRVNLVPLKKIMSPFSRMRFILLICIVSWCKI